MKFDDNAFNSLKKLPADPLHLISDPTARSRKQSVNQKIEEIYRNAIACGQQSNLIGVLNNLRTAHHMAPEQPQVLLLLAQIFKSNNKNEYALDLLDEIVSMGIKEADIFLLYGRWLAEIEDYKKAIFFFEKYIKYGGNKALGLTLLGASHNSLNDKIKANKIFKKLANLQPIDIREKKINAKIRLGVIWSNIAQETRFAPKSSDLYAVKTNNLPGLFDPIFVELTWINVDSDDLFTHPNNDILKSLDLILNSLSNANNIPVFQDKISRIAEYSKLRVLNAPEFVMSCTREKLWRRFGHDQKIRFPKAVSVELHDNFKNCVQKAADEFKFDPPFIVRLSDYDTGKFMHLVHDLDSHDFSELETQINQANGLIEVIEYIDNKNIIADHSEEIYFKKYSAFMVNKKIFPVHLYFGSNFNVCYKDDVLFKKLNTFASFQEREYLEEPEKHLGADLWKNLHDLMLEINLDYFGVDFTVIHIGVERKIICFELNAEMSNWVEFLPPGDIVQTAWRHVTEETHLMLCEIANIPPWRFIIGNSALRN